MDFAYDARTQALRENLLDFMDAEVYPAEPVFHQQFLQRADPWSPVPVVEDLKVKARKRGLWNLFLPGEHGAGLTTLQYAAVAEITGAVSIWRPSRSIAPHLIPATWKCCTCSAPPSRNSNGYSRCWTGRFAPRSR